MKRLTVGVLIITFAATLLFIGCGSSGQGQSSSSTAATTSSDQPVVEERTKADTVNVDVQNTQKSPYESKTTPTASPTGSYSVQIGVYKMADNAERVASLARERFRKNVYTIPDKIADLYKVMVGDFNVKDDARKFRDEMVQQYPSDYKDAWVTEVSQR